MCGRCRGGGRVIFAAVLYPVRRGEGEGLDLLMWKERLGGSVLFGPKPPSPCPKSPDYCGQSVDLHKGKAHA